MRSDASKLRARDSNGSWMRPGSKCCWRQKVYGFATREISLASLALCVLLERVGRDLELTATTILNCTYSRINRLLVDSGASPVPMKHELTELALVEPPEELARAAVTVMDGPFFSLMPYPSRDLHCSASRFDMTRHRYSWEEGARVELVDGDAYLATRPSRFVHMTPGAGAISSPSCRHTRYVDLLFEVKNAHAPQRAGRQPADPSAPQVLNIRVCGMTVLGAKIDSVYDVEEALAIADGQTARAMRETLVSVIAPLEIETPEVVEAFVEETAGEPCVASSRTQGGHPGRRRGARRHRRARTRAARAARLRAVSQTVAPLWRRDGDLGWTRRRDRRLCDRDAAEHGSAGVDPAVPRGDERRHGHRVWHSPAPEDGAILVSRRCAAVLLVYQLRGRRRHPRGFDAVPMHEPTSRERDHTDSRPRSVSAFADVVHRIPKNRGCRIRRSIEPAARSSGPNARRCIWPACLVMDHTTHPLRLVIWTGAVLSLLNFARALLAAAADGDWTRLNMPAGFLILVAMLTAIGEYVGGLTMRLRDRPAYYVREEHTSSVLLREERKNVVSTSG